MHRTQEVSVVFAVHQRELSQLFILHQKLLKLIGNRSGKYGNPFMSIPLSYCPGASRLATAFDSKIAIRVGIKFLICPDISKAMIAGATVCVTPPVKAAPPAIA